LTIPVELNVGAKASLVCWGVMPSGILQHPLFRPGLIPSPHQT